MVVVSSGFTTSPTRGIAVIGNGNSGWSSSNNSLVPVTSDGKITISTYTNYKIIQFNY